MYSFRFLKVTTLTYPSRPCAGVLTPAVAPRHIIDHEYFFQVHSGTKLPTRITTKASQNRFQSNEMTESTFRAPMMPRSGNRIPSILQWTLPQDRPFMRQPIPAHATAITQRAPLAVSEITEAP